MTALLKHWQAYPPGKKKYNSTSRAWNSLFTFYSRGNS